MYNEELKQRFIEDCIQGDGSKKVVTCLFNATERFEVEWGADLCTRSSEELQPMLNEVLTIRSNTQSVSMSYLRTYARWCMEHGVPNVSVALLEATVDSSEKIRAQTVQSPLQLQRYLNAVFAPEEEESIDLLYRCFLWCAYIGIEEQDVQSIQTKDVDLEKMFIYVRDKRFKLYQESLTTFRKVVQLTSFSYSHKNYGTIRRERNEGTALFRGYKGETKLRTLRIGVTGNTALALKEGRTTQRLSYEKAKLSGLFYRIYEMECTGRPVDFGRIAAESIEEKASAQNNSPEYLRLMRLRKKRELMKDYANWKRAFLL